MNKLQIALVLGGAALIILLFQLPRVVVENETLVGPKEETHSFTMPQEVKTRISQLRTNWSSEEIIEKKLNFADSLATLYLDYQVLDSGVWFVDYIKSTNSEGRELRIADLLYRAFQRTADPEEAREIGARAGQELKSLLELYPQSSSLKNRLAMTLVATENPMQGIQMLRSILEENPEDIETMMNLGILSIQSGQFDKAEERFKDLLAIDSTNEEARFYLGMSQIEQGNEEGKLIMQQLSNSANPAIKALAIEYLEN
ncbi:MAG: tetratricopeptide repeat protein [Cyclobacteriaceae bacterium]